MRAPRTIPTRPVSARQASARRKVGAVLFALMLPLAPIGCAVGEAPGGNALREADRLALDQAMQRWNACLDRHAARVHDESHRLISLHDAALRTQRNATPCEGHRRDVAMRFAPHLEARVASRLRLREHAAAASLNGASAGVDQPDRVNDTAQVSD